MALDDKKIIIDRHLENLKESKGNSKKSILFLLGGALLVVIIGFMSFGNPFGDSIATPNLPMEVWEIEEKPKSVLVSSSIVEDTEIVAIINPTKEQMARLKRKKAGRKVIRENRKRARKTEVNQIKLTDEEVTMLEDANILGSDNNIFNQSDLKSVQSNKIGISDETYSAEEVKGLNMVTYIQKEPNGDK